MDAFPWGDNGADKKDGEDKYEGGKHEWKPEMEPGSGKDDGAQAGAMMVEAQRAYAQQAQAPAAAPTPPTRHDLTTRKYRMESDIFGTGFGPSSTQSPTARYGMTIERGERGDGGRASSGRGAEPAIPAGMPTPLHGGPQQMASFPEEPIMEERGGARRNARETGGNPLTGEGYTDPVAHHSQRRQFGPSKSTPLW